jgi:hypothetical protein
VSLVDKMCQKKIVAAIVVRDSLSAPLTLTTVKFVQWTKKASLTIKISIIYLTKVPMNNVQ